MIRFFIGIFVYFSLTSLVAAAWTPVSKSDGYAQYVDFSTTKHSGNRIQVLEMLDFTTPQRFGQRSMILTMEYDCSSGLFRGISGKIYSGNMGKGSEIPAPSETTEWTRPRQGSISENTIKELCRGQR